MTGTAHPRGDEMRHVKWLSIFADREEPRARIALLLEELSGQAVATKPSKPVLQFYGVSGQGKSSLLDNTRSEAHARFPKTHFASLDLADLDPSRVAEPVAVLWSLTDALAKAGIMAPLTLCLYIHYWRKQNPAQEFRVQDTPLKEHLERCIRGCEILSPFTDLLKVASDVGQAAFKVIAVAAKCWEAARDRAREMKIKDLRDDEPGVWDRERIERSFPEFLALDIFTHLRSHGDRNLCIAIDTFERLEPGAKGDLPERMFQDLCARLVDPSDPELRGRSAVLLFGREKIRWERYDRGASTPWSKHFESIELRGFTKPNAVSFLRNEFTKFWEQRAAEVVEKLRTHEAAILEASSEQEAVESYLPYYLRLAGEMIYEMDNHFVPEMLGRSPDEMQERFLKYLRERSPEKFTAIRTLSLALYFDDALFDHLVRTFHIQGIPVGNLVPGLLANRSYVRRLETSYRFHRHMQQSLLDDMEKSEEDIQTAQTAIEAILDYYANQAAFATPADFRPDVHLPAYQHGMDIVLTHAGRGWLSRESASEWRNRLEQPFDGHTATAARLPIAERTLAVWSRLWGTDCLDGAALLNNLGALHWHQGRYRDAEPLLVRALAIREKALGSSHPSTSSSLNNLAALYREQGRFEIAEPLLLRALEIREEAFGPDHPDTATTLNNLVSLHRALGRFDKAEPLLLRVLAIREKALGPDHPDTAQSLNNLADMYCELGRFDEAEPLHLRALAIDEKALGTDHPGTATALNNLAGLYCDQGQFEKAKPLYLRALEIDERALGPKHPVTATDLNNLASLYDDLGRPDEAEPLYLRAIAIREESLGPIHPSTATSLNNLAVLYDVQGRPDEAEPLYLRALEILEKALGPKHPKTARVKKSYEAFLRDKNARRQPPISSI